jgi:plastocyanin
MRALPAALLVAALALAGCSGKTSDSTAAGSPTSSGPASTASPSATSGSPTTTAPPTSPSPSPSSSPTSAPRPARTIEIDIKGNAFVDGTQTIQKGDTVHWVHMDGTTPHSVASDEGKFSSDTAGLPCPGPGCMTATAHSTFDFTFDEVGSFPYHCEVHSGMRNTLTVVAALPA